MYVVEQEPFAEEFQRTSSESGQHLDGVAGPAIFARPVGSAGIPGGAVLGSPAAAGVKCGSRRLQPTWFNRTTIGEPRHIYMCVVRPDMTA